MLTTSFYGFLIVLASVLSAVVGLMLTQRLIPLHVRERHNTATGNIYAALYVMFGISVGFALYLTWQQYNTARQIAHSEAASVGNRCTGSRRISPGRRGVGFRS